MQSLVVVLAPRLHNTFVLLYIAAPGRSSYKVIVLHSAFFTQRISLPTITTKLLSLREYALGHKKV
jgi:hypothetical protein